MGFTGPFSDDTESVPASMNWLLPGQMLGTFLFQDPTLHSTVRYRIMPSTLSGYALSGFVGDSDYEDDLFNMESFELPLQQVAPAKRWLSLFLMPREKDGSDFDFSVVFFSDRNDFPNQEYAFRSASGPIGIRIPVRFVR